MTESTCSVCQLARVYRGRCVGGFLHFDAPATPRELLRWLSEDAPTDGVVPVFYLDFPNGASRSVVDKATVRQGVAMVLELLEPDAEPSL